MKAITVSIFICAFMLLRPYQLQNSGLMYRGDDFSYMAHATSLAYFNFPFYDKEYFEFGQGTPLHPIGASLLASPFVFAASIIDRACGSDIVAKRTPANIIKSWTAFGFTLASVFYLWLACLLLYKGLVFYFQPQVASLTVILAVLSQGVPLFAFRRPVFSHIYEIFLQSLFLFLLLRLNKAGGYIFPVKEPKVLREAVLVGILAGFITLVRYNNIFMSLAWPAILFSLYYPRISVKKIITLAVISYLSMAIFVFMFQIFPIFLNLPDIHQYKGYLSMAETKMTLFTLYGPGFYIKRLGHCLGGLDWGLVFTAPYLLLGLFYLPWIKKDKIRAYLLLLLVPSAANLYIILASRQQGGWYGYRYLIFSFIPIIVYPMASLISLLKEKKPYFYYATIIIAILPVLSMLSFEGNNTNLTLRVIDQGFGVASWGSNTYQMEIYKTIVTKPVDYLAAILKAGPVYLAYLLSALPGLKRYLPEAVYDRYGVFRSATLIKTTLVYLFPFVLLWIYKKRQG
ncbi:MAG: hypothetical protein V1869_01175 [Candidatus Omnitrophota bacterium]